jgi:hypothetical protein
LTMITKRLLYSGADFMIFESTVSTRLARFSIELR